MVAWAILAGLAIGISLGALGGGGSVLTVPALVYLLHQDPHAATAGSLVIVGLTAAAGAVSHWRAGRVRVGLGVVFGLLGVAGSYAGSRVSAAFNEHLLLVAFALLMVVAAVAMLRRQPVTAPRAVSLSRERPFQWQIPVKVLAAATVVGLLTGFFGVGGGFLVVPALVLALGFGMPVAVGTSLLVIAINSAAAFTARLGGGLHMDWPLIGLVTGAAILGTLAGKRVADRVSPQVLTRAFVVLLLVLASYVLARSLAALL